MKFQLGIAACLLAGCATQPAAWGHRREGALAADRMFTPHRAAILQIGVEYLPPEDESAIPEVDRTAVGTPESSAPAPTTLVERRLVPDGRHTWALSATDLAAIDDPFARETLRFMDDLVREDRRRGEREVRLPFLEWQPADLDLGQRLWNEETLANAQAEWVHQNGARVLSRPFRRMLRRFPLVSDLEFEVDDFRSSFVPLSEPYQQTHDEHRDLGRISLRLHASDLQDPLEIAWLRSGFKIATSQDRGRVSLDVPLCECVSFAVRSQYDYLTERTHLRADVAYRHSATTSLRFAIGDDMDFLSTSSIYSVFEAPMAGGPGLLLYAVHIF
ncbi:MAG: hypothetical protein KDE27_25665 [Planctomycetes bacterium]|nr:hypothetical protein [Planctomycetota bacterium]